MIYESTYQSIFSSSMGSKDYHLAEDVSQNAYLRICEKFTYISEEPIPRLGWQQSQEILH